MIQIYEFCRCQSIKLRIYHFLIIEMIKSNEMTCMGTNRIGNLNCCSELSEQYFNEAVHFLPFHIAYLLYSTFCIESAEEFDCRCPSFFSLLNLRTIYWTGLDLTIAWGTGNPYSRGRLTGTLHSKYRKIYHHQIWNK